jgi:hypothetical protein
MMCSASSRYPTQLLERVADLTIERNVYRELAQQAIHALAELQAKDDHREARYFQLVEECRTLRTMKAA